jgi:hypothetical protein
MLKYHKSKEYEIKVKQSAVFLVAKFLEGITEPIKPKDLEELALRITDLLEEWYAKRTVSVEH